MLPADLALIMNPAKRDEERDKKKKKEEGGKREREKNSGIVDEQITREGPRNIVEMEKARASAKKEPTPQMFSGAGSKNSNNDLRRARKQGSFFRSGLYDCLDKETIRGEKRRIYGRASRIFRLGRSAT